MIGKVIWFDNKKGYGFISSKEIDTDLFVHFSDICESGFKSLNKDQEIFFSIGENYFGKQKAINVKIIK